jgi:hypothetical protein
MKQVLPIVALHDMIDGGSPAPVIGDTEQRDRRKSP